MSETKPQQPAQPAKKKLGFSFGKGAQNAREAVRELSHSLVSKDHPTRKMSAFFFLSVFAALAVLGLGVHRYREVRKHLESESEKSAKHLGDFLARQAEENKHKAAQIPIGTFSIELKPMDGQKPIPGVQDLAEIELVLDCDTKETREFVEDHLPQIRNQVTNYFTAMERSELMGREGKAKIKRGIIELLNAYLPHGKVEDVYVTRFLMS